MTCFLFLLYSWSKVFLVFPVGLQFSVCRSFPAGLIIFIMFSYSEFCPSVCVECASGRFCVCLSYCSLLPPLVVRGFGLCAAAVLQPSGVFGGVLFDVLLWAVIWLWSGWLRAGLSRLTLLTCTRGPLEAAVWITMDLTAASSRLLIRRIQLNDPSSCLQQALI